MNLYELVGGYLTSTKCIIHLVLLLGTGMAYTVVTGQQPVVTTVVRVDTVRVGSRVDTIEVVKIPGQWIRYNNRNGIRYAAKDSVARNAMNAINWRVDK